MTEKQNYCDHCGKREQFRLQKLTVTSVQGTLELDLCTVCGCLLYGQFEEIVRTVNEKRAIERGKKASEDLPSAPR